MGNRAIIAFEPPVPADMAEEQGFITIDQHAEHRETAAGIYLQWQGGRDSVEVFLQAAKHFKLRCDDYGCARLAQIIGNWFGGTFSLGAGCVSSLASARGDNGIYWISNWEIVDREDFEGDEQQPSDSTPTLGEVIAASDEFFNPPPVSGDKDHCYGCATMRHPCIDDLDPSKIESAALNKIIYENGRQKLRERKQDSGALGNGQRLRDIYTEDQINNLIFLDLESQARAAAEDKIKNDLDIVRSETFAEL